MNYRLNQTAKEVFHQVLDIRNRFEIQYNRIKPLRFDPKESREMCPGPKYDKWEKLEGQYSQEALQDFHDNVIKKFSSLISTKRNPSLFKIIHSDMSMINLISKADAVNTLQKELAQLVMSSQLSIPYDLRMLRHEINGKLYDIKILLSAYHNDDWFIYYDAVPHKRTYEPVHAFEAYLLLDGILNDVNLDIFHKDVTPYENHRYC